MSEGVQGEGVVRLPVTVVQPGRFQPRRRMGSAELAELVESIRVHGVIQPVIVRPVGDRFELVAGERRWRAAQQAGLQEIPALVRALDDREAALVALVENLQREDLHFLEEAEAYERLLREFGMTQEELAARLGRSQSFIANRLRLLRLPLEVREIISREMLSERHARALLQLPGAEEQKEVAREIAARRLNVRDAERLVARLAAERGERGRKRKIKGVVKDVRIFLNAFRQAARALEAAGVAVEVREEESEETIDIYVRIAKGRTGARKMHNGSGRGAGPWDE